MTSLENIMKGKPIHPDPTPILHPRIKSIIKPLILPFGIIFMTTNFFMGYLPTRSMINDGLNRREIEADYRVANEKFGLPISITAALGRELALYLHGNEVRQENPKPSNSYPKNAA